MVLSGGCPFRRSMPLLLRIPPSPQDPFPLPARPSLICVFTNPVSGLPLLRGVLCSLTHTNDIGLKLTQWLREDKNTAPFHP